MDMPARQDRSAAPPVERARVLVDGLDPVLRAANDIVLLLDARGRILDANGLAVRQYGYDMERLRSMNVLDLRVAESREEGRRQFAQVKAEGSIRFTATHVRWDGSRFQAEVSAAALGEGAGLRVVSFIRDGSEREARERELRRMTQLYRALSEVNEAMVRSKSRGGLFDQVCEALARPDEVRLAWIAWNDAATGQVWPASRSEDPAGLLDRLAIRSDGGPEGSSVTGLALRQGVSCVVNDYLALEASTPFRGLLLGAGVLAVGAFPLQEGGRIPAALVVYAGVAGYFGPEETALLERVAQNLSYALDHLAGEERRRRLIRSLRKVSVAVEQSPLAIEITDRHGAIEYVNPAWSRTAGASLQEVLGQDSSALTLLHGTGVSGAPQAALPRGDMWTGDMERLRDDGTRCIERVLLAPVREEDGTLSGYILVKEDVTQARQEAEARQKLEAHLLQTQKLEALGCLAGGVAHDLNNVLGAILGLAQALREEADPFAPSARNLDTIVGACLRGRGVVKGLLYSARQGLQEQGPVDLNRLAQEVARLLDHTTLKRVNLHLELDEGIGRVRGDEGSLSHALMNLCVNALDAMPEGGDLRITTGRGPEGGILLTVRDSGEGMPPEVLARAMDPFFTTKPSGKGTGLGLAMVSGTMNAHEGRLDMVSVVGSGTEVRLWFPPGRREASQAPEPAPVVREGTATRQLRILLVDDDELVRESFGPMLEMLGHQVTLSSSGAGALAHVEAGLALDLVILDMNMPGMTGREVLPRLRGLRPGLPVLLATGYVEEDALPLVAQHQGVWSLGKPFTLAEIQEVLDRIAGAESVGPQDVSPLQE